MKAKRVKETLLGRDFRKVQPKLRMIANGSQEVNEVRSDLSAALIVAKKEVLTYDSP